MVKSGNFGVCSRYGLSWTASFPALFGYNWEGVLSTLSDARAVYCRWLKTCVWRADPHAGIRQREKDILRV